MTIWKKIFLYSIVLFIILFNGASIFIIENIYSNTLNNAIVSSINEYKNLRNSIYLNSDLSYLNVSELLNIVKSYMYSDSAGIKNIEIFDINDNRIVNTNNLNISKDRDELKYASIDECQFIIRGVDNENMLFISSILKIGNENYKLVTTKDINYIYEERIRNYQLFIILSLIVTILLAIGMYFISKSVTYPINELIDISNRITKGDYSKKAKENNKDEIGMLAINFNIMIQEVEDKIKELNFINEQKQRFIDDLTHEMKTPITSIMGYSELLLKGNVNEEIKLKALNYINSQGKRLENLNSSLLKLIMIKNINNSNEVNSIKDILYEVVNSMEYKLYNKSINLEKHIDNIYVLGDKDLTILLLINILDNAIKASDDNSNIYIEGRLTDNNDYNLKIIDVGIGISNDDLKNVREPFYMADKSRTISSKNLGLGLSICQEICIVNNIAFKIESELNKGTVVTLVFKVGKIYETKI